MGSSTSKESLHSPVSTSSLQPPPTSPSLGTTLFETLGEPKDNESKQSEEVLSKFLVASTRSDENVLMHYPGIVGSVLGPLASKPAHAIACCLILVAIPYLHPKLDRFRLIRNAAEHEAEMVARGSTGINAHYGEVVIGEQKNEKPSNIEDPQAPSTTAATMVNAKGHTVQTVTKSAAALAVGARASAIEDPSGRSMTSFYKSLLQSTKGETGSITRVAHYGDSLLASDFMSSTLRRRFQNKFGDSGHGFILVTKGWEFYYHADIQFWSSGHWSLSRIVNPRINDEMYGYGGVSFRSSTPGASATFATNTSNTHTQTNTIGLNASRFLVQYLEQPKGGNFEIWVDKQKSKTVSTQGELKKLSMAEVHVPDGEHTFQVRIAGGGESRLFGVVLERDVHGVVWDSIGILGARARMLLVNEPMHWAAALQSRNPSLIVFQYGTNESEDAGYPMPQYEQTLEQLLKQARAALPNASCLVVGTMDRAGRAGAEESLPIVLKLSESQRRVAFKVGCAFWNTFYAMGGPGSMSRWVKNKLGSGDRTHPTMAGATLLGDLLFESLMNEYDTFLNHSSSHGLQ